MSSFTLSYLKLRLFVVSLGILFTMLIGIGRADELKDRVLVGAEVLARRGFSDLAGKRVGLITNHTSVVHNGHLIDYMANSGEMRLVALFAPEHGLRGVEEDGVAIAGGRDSVTGVPIFSLYGKVKKPPREMLQGLDVLVFDIQDVGARFYTYISTMGLAMEAAAEADIPFIVLDRPNPLGGEYVAGPSVSKAFTSFVGLYPIPIAHGLTVGELALMIKGEKFLPGLERLDLRVVKMAGWERRMQWPDTGRPWVRTSPNIPDFETALLYSGLCFLEATRISEGRGTREPFKVIGVPGTDSAALSARLNAMNMPGLRFIPTCFVPEPISGMSSKPKFRANNVHGVRICIEDRRAVHPVETAVYLLSEFYCRSGSNERKGFFQRDGFDLLAGSNIFREEISAGRHPDDIVAQWRAEVVSFLRLREKYLLY